jgi:hypothetical protein
MNTAKITYADSYVFIDISEDFDVKMEKIDKIDDEIDWVKNVEAGKFSETNFFL